MVGPKDLLLHPNTIKMGLDQAFFVSVHSINRIRTGHTEEEVVHQVNDDLFNQIEVRKTRELAVSGCVLLHKGLTSGGCNELTIVVTESMMLLACPTTKCYNRQADIQHSTDGPDDSPLS